MKQWTRWQDWVALGAGGYAVVSPIWTSTDARANSTVVALGAITALATLLALALPENVLMEGLHPVIGVLFLVAPWVIGFSGVTGMATTSWVLGVVLFAVGLWALPASREARREQIRQGRMATGH